MSHAVTKLKHLEQARRLLLETETGLTPTELAQALGVDRTSAHRYLKDLEPAVRNSGNGIYRYQPSQEDVTFAQLVLQRAGQDQNSPS